MASRLRRLLTPILAAASLVAACKPSSTAATTPPITADSASSAPRTTASVVAPPASSSALAGCGSDADCDWDEPCKPVRCIQRPRTPRACDKSFPPPGACKCVSGACVIEAK